MSTVGVVVVTILLTLVAGITAGFWLNLLLWIPMIALEAIGVLREGHESGFVIANFLAMGTAAAVVFALGISFSAFLGTPQEYPRF